MNRQAIAGALARWPIRLLLAMALVSTGWLGVRAAEGVLDPEPSATAASGSPEPTAVSPATETPSSSVTPRPSASASPSIGPTADPSPSGAQAYVEASFNLAGGGARNIVMVTNRRDGGYTGRGEVQLNRIPGPRVGPVNLARAYASCTDCQTYAVALQINLYQRGAPQVTPQNAAVAINVGCTRCRTFARAMQYVIPVDDVSVVPRDVRELAREMDRALREATREGELSFAERNARINAVIAQFRQLAEYLIEVSDQETQPDSPEASESPDATASATSDPSATVEPTGSPGATDSPAPTPEPSLTSQPEETPSSSR